jgi:RNA polymerase sigma-70 factor, ECF subfamily
LHTIKKEPVLNRDNKLISSLIENAKAGNNSAFEQLYRLNVGRVYAVCLRLFANLRFSEETTRKVFETVIEEINFKRDDFSFTGWVTGIAVHLTLSEMRGNEIYKETDKERESLRVKSVLLSNTDKFIVTLPENIRVPFVLHYIEKYSIEETADLMGVSQVEVTKSIKEAFSNLMGKL